MTFRRTALLVGVFPILALAGCGGAPAEVGVASVAKTGGPSPEASPSASPDPLKFAQCMRENGIEMADPEIKGGSVMMRRPEGGNKAAMEKAQKACEDHLPGRPDTSEGPTG